MMNKISSSLIILSLQLFATSIAQCEGLINTLSIDSRILYMTALDKSNALVFQSEAAKPKIIQTGGRVRGNPVLSPNGSFIAFIQVADHQKALYEVVVVSHEGKELARVQIEPVEGDLRYPGMRFIEQLRWLSNKLVMVSGSVNPSLSQYYVVDVELGQVVNSVLDDNSAAAWSPDGLHVASVSGNPHFGTEDTRAPEISIDDEVIYPPSATSDIVIESSPTWSKDGHSLAWVVHHRRESAYAIVFWQDRAIRETTLPGVPKNPDFSSRWLGSRFVVNATPENETIAPIYWSLDAGARQARIASPEQVVDPAENAKRLRRKLQDDASAAGFSEADFWCKDCELSMLPRESVH